MKTKNRVIHGFKSDYQRFFEKQGKNYESMIEYVSKRFGENNQSAVNSFSDIDAKDQYQF
jgi:hypothetical protein